uniref:Uncharacterized protein n=1 Tax=Steinernema glaseri TaxID=37863 RepID=A0A1I8A1Z0_9BILA
MGRAFGRDANDEANPIGSAGIGLAKYGIHEQRETDKTTKWTEAQEDLGGGALDLFLEMRSRGKEEHSS